MNHPASLAEILVTAIPFWFAMLVASLVAGVVIWPGLFYLSAIAAAFIGAGMVALFFVAMPLPSPINRATGGRSRL